MAKDKDLLTEGQMNRWAKLANIKSSLSSGMLTEASEPGERKVEPLKGKEDLEKNVSALDKKKANESVVEETVTEELEDLEGEEEMLDDLGDEAPEEDMPVDEGTVEELVSAIAGAIQDVTGVEVNVEGDAEEDLEGDDFEPAEDEDLGDDDDLMEADDDELMEGDGDDVEHTGNVQDYTQTDATVITMGKPTTGGSAAGLKAGPKASEYAGKETEIKAAPRVATKKKPANEALVQEQVQAVRNYIISEVANRVRARAQHEAQKQQLAESLADKIFAKLRNKKG